MKHKEFKISIVVMVITIIIGAIIGLSEARKAGGDTITDYNYVIVRKN